MNYHFDYIASIFLLLAYILLARKSVWGFVASAIAQIFWILCGITSNLSGMAVFSVVFFIIAIYGMINWSKANDEEEVIKNGQSR